MVPNSELPFYERACHQHTIIAGQLLVACQFPITVSIFELAELRIVFLLSDIQKIHGSQIPLSFLVDEYSELTITPASATNPMWQCFRGVVLSIVLVRIPYANNTAASEPTPA